MKVYDGPFEYEMAWKSVQPRCDLTVWELGRGQSMFEPRSTYVVLFAEPTDGYEGVSVTNGAERIATAVWRNVPELRQSDYARAIWIEHYSAASWNHKHDESFDLVTFDWDRTARGPVAERPVWHRVSREWVETLVKEEI